MLTTIITHAIFGLICGGGGWYLKGKYGSKVAQVVTAVETPPKP